MLCILPVCFVAFRPLIYLHSFIKKKKVVLPYNILIDNTSTLTLLLIIILSMDVNKKKKSYF